VLSVVNANLHNSGASERFYEQVEPGSQLARPKLVGFHAPADPYDCQYAVYMNRSVMFDDSFHLTTSVARALVHLECVCCFFDMHDFFLSMLILVYCRWCMQCGSRPRARAPSSRCIDATSSASLSTRRDCRSLDRVVCSTGTSKN